MRLSYLLVAILITSGNVMGQQYSKLGSDTAAIQQLERTDAEAARTNDVETLVTLWTDDGVLLQPMMPPVIGKQNIRALLEKQKAGSSSVRTISYTEDWKERRISGDQAFEWGSITVGLRLPDGREVQQTVFAGRYLVKRDRLGWRFARVVITPAPKQQ